MSNVILTANDNIVKVKPKTLQGPKVTVLNCRAAETYEHPVPVISFNEWTHGGEQTPYPLGTHHVDVQRIYCDDIESEIDSTYRLFDYIDAVKIITFLDKYRGKDIMVHCAAGVSRSPACAKWMMDYMGWGRDFKCNSTVGFFDMHNTHIYYTLKRAMLDHPSTIDRIREANRG